MSTPTATLREDDHVSAKPWGALARSSGPIEGLATTAALLLCAVTRLPHRVLDAAGITAWLVSVVVVVAVVNGVRTLVRAPFVFDRSVSFSKWARGEAREFFLCTAIGGALTLPLYALLGVTTLWWLLAWVLFAAVSVTAQMVTPLTLRAESGPPVPADPSLAERVHALAARAGVRVGRDVLVSGKQGDRGGNAYVVGLGPTRRVVLQAGTAAWPPELVDQVVAHELGHWRLGHTARRLPLTVVTQLVTLALAAWLLSLDGLLRVGGVATFADPRSYPLLLLLTPLLALPARALLAWRDRAQERAADRFALSLLGQPDAFAAMLERAATDGGAARSLPWWRRLTASHPPISERAAACTRFASTS